MGDGKTVPQPIGACAMADGLLSNLLCLGDNQITGNIMAQELWNADQSLYACNCMEKYK
jgi:hypothetical protein